MLSLRLRRGNEVTSGCAVRLLASSSESVEDRFLMLIMSDWGRSGKECNAVKAASNEHDDDEGQGLRRRSAKGAEEQAKGQETCSKIA